MFYSLVYVFLFPELKESLLRVAKQATTVICPPGGINNFHFDFKNSVSVHTPAHIQVRPYPVQGSCINSQEEVPKNGVNTDHIRCI